MFIDERLSEDEKMMILAHEQGHYSCGHTNAQAVIGRNVQEEYEANEFSHYLLHKNIQRTVTESVAKHRKKIITALMVIGLLICGGIAAKRNHDRQLYEGEFYVTMHGEKYHRESCVTIQGHKIRRLTKEDVEEGKYNPCGVCRPDAK